MGFVQIILRSGLTVQPGINHHRGVCGERGEKQETRSWKGDCSGVRCYPLFIEDCGTLSAVHRAGHPARWTALIFPQLFSHLLATPTPPSCSSSCLSVFVLKLGF